MQIADLYIRVSTDEQADKGYSQRDQEDRLRTYCERNGLAVGRVMFEDHSAKSFIRPEWKHYLSYLKSKKNRPAQLLFTKWDRFSRNAADAYQMLNILSEYGIVPCAIEQPVDLSVPEYKIMLAIFLAAPEVENDRRALNVIQGMRRAKKEGRVMGNAPFGYENKITQKGMKYIDRKEPEASIMIMAFNEIAKGVFCPDQVRKELARKGYKVPSRNAFYNGIRNPVYCGLVRVEKYKEEEAHFVKGQHEPLISEELFDEVQRIVEGRSRRPLPQTKILSDVHLPLRGFLICPKCGSNLTGSASKGRNNHYYYYHCQPQCGFRKPAQLANDIFEKSILKKMELNPVYVPLLKKLIEENHRQFINFPVFDREAIQDELKNLKLKVSSAREKLFANVIDDDDYVEIKNSCKERIEELEAQLQHADPKVIQSGVDKKLSKAVDLIANLWKLYELGGIEIKRKIVGSIFPEKLEFDGKHYRTGCMNVVADRIYQITNGLSVKKKRLSEDIPNLACHVPRVGIEPTHRSTRV